MSDKMQSRGKSGGNLTKSVNGKDNVPYRRERKDITGPDKEESNPPTLNQLSTATKEYSLCKSTTASTEHNTTDLGQSGVSRAKQKLSLDNQFSTSENINNDQHISSENNNSFKDVRCEHDSKHSIAKGPPDFSRWSTSSGNKNQCSKCSISSGTKRKAPNIPSCGESSDDEQRFLNLNRQKSFFPPDQSLPDLQTHGGKESNSEPVLVINNPASSSTSDVHPSGCFKSEHGDTVDTFSNCAAILVQAGVSIADVLGTDNNKDGSTNLSEETSQQGPSADWNDVKQCFLNLNSYKYVYPPGYSLPDLPTHGSKQSNSEQLVAINSPPSSSAAGDHPPGLKSEHDYTTESSNGVASLVQVGDSKGDVLDTVKDKGEGTDPSQQTSQQGPSGDPTVVEEQGHADSVEAGGKALRADANTEFQNVPEGVEEQGNANIFEAGGKARSAVSNTKFRNVPKAHEALDYFGRSNAENNVVTETNRSMNNSLSESKQAYEVPCVSKEGATGKFPEEPPLKDKYGKNFRKHPSDNSNNNKFIENSTRSYVDSRSSRSGENGKSKSIALSKKNIQQPEQGHRHTSEDTRSKTIGESASSVLQPRNANLQANVEALRANGANAKQQDKSKLVVRCAELDQLVKKLQCDNDLMKTEMEDLRRRNSNLKNENVNTEQLVKKLQCDNNLMKTEMEDLRRRNSNLENENVNAKISLEGSLQLIEKCDALVVPVIKELKNKETLFKAIVRYFSGKTLMSDNILDKIGHVCDYAKTVTNNIIDLTDELNKNNSTIDGLRSQVTNVQSELKKSDEKFKQKTEKQLKILEETELTLKNELEAKKNIDDKLKASAECIKKYKKELKNYEGQSELIELLKQDLFEKIQTINDFEKHSELLQNILKEAEHQLEYYNKQMKSTHSGLQTAERNFHQHFESFKTGITEHSKMLSLEENSKQAEKNFIDNAVQRIMEIKKNAEQYELHIKEFEGNMESKTYLDIKEKLQRRIQELDNVESQKRVEILSARKEAVNYITRLGADLERKVIRC